MSGTVADIPAGEPVSVPTASVPERSADIGDAGIAGVLGALAALTGTAVALVLRPREPRVLASGGPAARRFAADALLPTHLLSDPRGRLADAMTTPPSIGAPSRRRFVVALARHLRDDAGEAIGTLVLLDTMDREIGLESVQFGLVEAMQAQLAMQRRVNLLNRTLAETRRESAMAQRESAAKSNFLAAMSHELRTPLNAIIGFSEIMKDQLFGPLGSASYVEYAADVHDCGRHLLSLINDVLDMAKIAAHRMAIAVEWLDVGAALQHAGRMVMTMAHKRGISVAVSTDPKALKVLADDRALKQILFNLLSNAVKYSRPSGNVMVHGQGLADGSVAITVEDNGIGMDEEQIQRLFRPFERADNRFDDTHQGIGLGLALVHNLISLHGGTISIDSAPGAGTRVTIRFPCDRRAVVRTAGVAVGSRVDGAP